MNYSISLLGIFCGIAVATCFYISSYFFFIKTKDRFKNNLLGLLFIAIGLRIAKSIAYFIFIDIISIGLAIGYLGLASIGPFLLLYMNSIRYKKNKLTKMDLLHFIIPVLGVFACLLTHLGHVTLLYKSVTGILFIYILVAIKIHVQNNYSDNDIKQWNTNLLLITSIIWISFVSQHLTPSIIKYAIGTGVASLSIYYIFIYALKSPIVFSKPNSKNISAESIKKVKNAFEKDKIYLTHAITLNEFAKYQGMPTYIVRKSVRQLYGKRFPEAINHFRVNEIKNKLVNPNDIDSKIEVLAYEVGFNTPSSFYAAFKKETNMTPKEFQKANS